MKNFLGIFVMFVSLNFLCAEQMNDIKHDAGSVKPQDNASISIEGLRKHLDYPYTKIEGVGSIKNLSLFVFVDQEDWFEKAVFYNSKTDEVTELNDISESAIYSAKIIKTGRKDFFEVVGLTHMGHGSVYLYDSDGKVFFEYSYVDIHHESMQFPDYISYPFLRNAVENNLYESYGKVFENETLNMDYSKFDQGILRIYGKCNYIGDDGYDNSEVLGSEEIERIFTYTNNNWVLTESKGSIDNIPFLDSSLLYNNDSDMLCGYLTGAREV